MRARRHEEIGKSLQVVQYCLIDAVAGFGDNIIPHDVLPVWSDASLKYSRAALYVNLDVVGSQHARVQRKTRTQGRGCEIDS
jgi:hypothetical protein